MSIQIITGLSRPYFNTGHQIGVYVPGAWRHYNPRLGLHPRVGGKLLGIAVWDVFAIYGYKQGFY